MAIWLDRIRLFWQYCRARRYDLIWSAVRVPVAFLVAPLGAPIVILLFAVPELLQGSASLFQTPLFILFLGYSFVIAYLATFTVGVLLFRILRKLELTQFWIAPAVGSIMPVILISIIVGPSFIVELRPASVILVVGLPGAVVGAILWLIARPDRAAA
jgi:hypothetical protein